MFLHQMTKMVRPGPGRNQEILLGLFCEWQEPKIWGHPLLLVSGRLQEVRLDVEQLGVEPDCMRVAQPAAPSASSTSLVFGFF